MKEEERRRTQQQQKKCNMIIKYNRTERENEKKKRERMMKGQSAAQHSIENGGQASCECREGSGCHRLPPDSTGNVRQVLEGFINFFLNFTCPLLCTSSIYFVKSPPKKKKPNRLNYLLPYLRSRTLKTRVLANIPRTS